MEQTPVRNNAFFQGRGEMAVRMKAFDWSSTAVGMPDQWPQSLRTTVSMILASKFPMFLWWGEDLVQFYNDAYRPSLGEKGKHPMALGARGVDTWQEIWPMISPLIKQVRKGEEAIWFENQLVPIYRNGKLEEVYWTFSYSAVRDESGNIGGVLVVCQETTQQVKSLKLVKDREKDFYNLIMQAPSAIALFKGPDYVIEIANDNVLQYWGRTREQVINKPLFEALPEAAGQGFEEVLLQVFTTGEPFYAKELTVELLRNGKLEKTYINFTYQPYHDEERNITGILVFCNEVTNEVLSRQQLEVFVEQMKASNDNLKKFAYAASHDLKEPIRKISMFSDRLKKQLGNSLTENQHFLFERMQKAVDRMVTLIDDLLSYSEATQGVPALQPIDLNQKLADVLEDLEMEVEGKAAVINSDHLPTIPGHKRQLEQLFQNLLTNALKYSKPGLPPAINIRSHSVTGNEMPLLQKGVELDKQYCLIEVEDNGIGFAQEDAERIFNVFTRLHGMAENNGSGIGLSIVKQVVENHNGHIWAESRPGEGSTFRILLPA